jgi:hypothetical protein
LQQVTLEPLDGPRIATFLRGYLGKTAGSELAHWLEQTERWGVRELCRVPFFVRLVAYLYEKERAFPARRVDLLDRYVQAAVRREQERLGQDWPPALLIEPLSDLALGMQERGVLEVWEDEARRCYLAAFEGGAEAALRLAEGAGLLRATLTAGPRGARLGFVHQLWQQDMAARALTRQAAGDGRALFDLLRPRLFDPSWAEVIPLAAARLGRADGVIEGLLRANRNDVKKQRPLLMAEAALAEGAEVGEATRQSVVDGLVNLAHRKQPNMSKPTDPGEIPRRLAALNAADGLLALAWDGAADAWVRQAAVESLRGLGRGDDLLTLARDETVNAEVRLAAAELLGQLGRVDEAAEALLFLVRDGVAGVAVLWKAVRLLGPTDKTAKALLLLARDEAVELQVREEAVAALGEMSRGDDLLALAQEQTLDPFVRAAATEALDKLRSPIPQPLGAEAVQVGMEHLQKLQRRLGVWTAAWIGSVAVAFGLFPLLLSLLARCYNAPVGGAVWSLLAAARLQIALAVGGALALPLLVYQIARYAGPALTQQERREALALGGIELALFYVGGALGILMLGQVILRGVPAISPGWALYILHRLSLLPAALYGWFLIARLLTRQLREITSITSARRRMRVLAIALLFFLWLTPPWVLSALIGVGSFLCAVFLYWVVRQGQKLR